jgi:hypothetical protein
MLAAYGLAALLADARVEVSPVLLANGLTPATRFLGASDRSAFLASFFYASLFHVRHHQVSSLVILGRETTPG